MRRAAVGPAQRLGQTPVDHQRLAVLADDDVARLDVAMEHAPAMGVVDGIADVGEPAQQPAQLQRPAGFRRITIASGPAIGIILEWS